MATQKITAWSPSRLEKYEECPRKAKYEILEKRKDPGGVASNRGLAIHKELEQYIDGRLAKPPAEALKVQAMLRRLRTDYAANKPIFVEQEIAFDKNWKPADWFGPTTWLRLKLDLIEIIGTAALVTDWKTGKYKPDGEYDDSLNLYSVGVLAKNPKLTEATGQLIFTDHTAEPVRRPEGTLKRPALARAIEKWNKRVAPMLNDTTFKPRPGLYCKWCPHGKSKGGPCEFGGEHREF